MISDLPPTIPIDDARIYCSVEAAARYFQPSEPVYAVALTEGGRPGIAVLNTNGTYDLGYMQFNTAYLKTLSRAGVKVSDVQKNSCYPFHLAAWRIRGHLEERSGADVFTKAAWYHSRTPEYNIIYRGKLIENARRFDFKKAAEFERSLSYIPEISSFEPVFEIKGQSSERSKAKGDQVQTWIYAK